MHLKVFVLLICILHTLVWRILSLYICIFYFFIFLLVFLCLFLDSTDTVAKFWEKNQKNLTDKKKIVNVASFSLQEENI